MSSARPVKIRDALVRSVAETTLGVKAKRTQTGQVCADFFCDSVGVAGGRRLACNSPCNPARYNLAATYRDELVDDAGDKGAGHMHERLPQLIAKLCTFLVDRCTFAGAALTGGDVNDALGCQSFRGKGLNEFAKAFP